MPRATGEDLGDGGAGASPSGDDLRRVLSGVGEVGGGETCLFRVAGKDARASLDRVLSQRLSDLEDGGGRLALLLSPRGQFRALAAVFALDDELLLLAPPGRGGDLAGALQRYLALSRCELVEAGRSGAPSRLLGPGWRNLAGHVDAAAVASGGVARAADGSLWLGQTFAGIDGVVVWPRDPAAVPAVPAVAPGAAELARIRARFPAWGAELTELVLPQEAGIAHLAVSTEKGCYVGQETMARLHTYGHVNRTLVGVRLRQGRAAPPLDLVPEGGEKTRGVLTSFGLDPVLGGLGLAIVRREHSQAGTILRSDTAVFEVADAG